MTGSGPSSELWIVRHGQTEWSRNGRHTSVTDLPLTQVGRRDAVQLQPRLRDLQFAAVLTSPRSRARQTAALAGYPDAQQDDDLAEWNYGDYEGLTTPQIREHDEGWSVWSHPSPGGEDAAHVAQRLDRVVQRVKSQPGRVLVFSHGHASRALTARWLELPVQDGRLFELDTGTVSVLAYERDAPVIRRWNS